MNLLARCSTAFFVHGTRLEHLYCFVSIIAGFLFGAFNHGIIAPFSRRR